MDSRWDSLYETAAAQEGMFTTQQAADAGYSPQLLVHHVNGGRFTRVQRRIYRLVHFPPGDHEDLVAAWLWSERAGVISHDTALSVRELSDVLPRSVHMTLPLTWRRRRVRVPDLIRLHYADVAPRDRTWHGSVPITSVRRTLNDCARGGLSPDLLLQATHQALRRGLVVKTELPDVAAALTPFGGLGNEGEKV